ncbi:cytochrome P450 [Cladorrhinum sp. PSN259]|nr:cytochrome P450 [Cladorrhinum sp. PSN259]
MEGTQLLRSLWDNPIPATTALIIGYIVYSIIYNLYFHPLAEYPGPLLARCTLLWRFYHSHRGLFHYAIHDAHRKYGPVIRLCPNELSFATVESWKAIYSPRVSSNRPLVATKSKFYDMFGAGFSSSCVGSERDPHIHARMRRMLNPAFSTKALLAQEDIITGVIDLFVEKLGQLGGPGTNGLNMSQWYEMVAFDIMGELAIGESFHGVENGKQHSWSEIIGHIPYFVIMIDNLRRIPLVWSLFRSIPAMVGLQSANSKYARDKVEQRLRKKTDRPDFLTTVIKSYESGEIAKEEVAAHASTIALAGAETLSTFYCATTYYLFRHPSVLSKLRREIDSAFPYMYSQINASSCMQKLPYLQAVIQESLRKFPPAAFGFPRLSPEHGMFVGTYFVPAGCEMSTHTWTLAHSEEYWRDPEVFRPERWVDKTDGKGGGGNNNNYDVLEASQPFSLGGNGCIGKNFAYLETNLILTKLLWKYDLEMVDPEFDWEEGPPRTKNWYLWTKPDFFVRFKERKRPGTVNCGSVTV